MPGSETVRRFQQGDPKALEELVEAHGQSLYRYLFFITSNEEWARDLTQSAFLTAYERRKTLLDPEKFRPWLFTIGRRKAHREISRVIRMREVSLEAPIFQDENLERKDLIEDPSPGSHARLSDQRARQILDNELQVLDELSRELILGHFLDGRSTRDLCKEYNIPYGTACTRIFRGLRTLREALEREGINSTDFLA